MNHGVSEATGSTSRSLIQRAQQQDPAAWERLSVLYVPIVYGWARQAGLQPSDAADVGQEIFHTLAVRIGDYRRNRGSGFRGWLWGISRNKLREFTRRDSANPQAAGGSVGRAQMASVADLPEDESNDFQKSETKCRLVHRALEVIRNEFEEQTWRAFWRTTVDQQRAVDVATESGMTAKAVRQAKYRVLRRLRQELADLG
jgi:RNA polymerase sigma-70 factor (ECF subfamily)